MNLGLDEFEELWEAITVLEAQELLVSLQVQDWPNLKRNAREQRHRKLHKLAYPSMGEEKQISSEGLANILKARLR